MKTVPQAFIISLLALVSLFTVGCGQTNPVISQLPSSDQTQIKKALNGIRNFKLPTSLPFKPTGGSASSASSLSRKASNALALTLYNDKERLVIKETGAATRVPNLPNGLKLSNGIPAEFKQTSGGSELWWNDSVLTITLDAQPVLTKKELLQVANSMEK